MFIMIFREVRINFFWGLKNGCFKDLVWNWYFFYIIMGIYVLVNIRWVLVGISLVLFIVKELVYLEI